MESTSLPDRHFTYTLLWSHYRSESQKASCDKVTTGYIRTESAPSQVLNLVSTSH